MVRGGREFQGQAHDLKKNFLGGNEQAETFTVGGSVRKVVLKLSWKPGADAKAVGQVRVEQDGVDVTWNLRRRPEFFQLRFNSDLMATAML